MAFYPSQSAIQSHTCFEQLRDGDQVIYETTDRTIFNVVAEKDTYCCGCSDPILKGSLCLSEVRNEGATALIGRGYLHPHHANEMITFKDSSVVSFAVDQSRHSDITTGAFKAYQGRSQR